MILYEFFFGNFWHFLGLILVLAFLDRWIVSFINAIVIIFDKYFNKRYGN